MPEQTGKPIRLSVYKKQPEPEANEKTYQAGRARKTQKEMVESDHDFEVFRGISNLAAEIDESGGSDEEKIRKLLEGSKFARTARMLEIAMSDTSPVGMKALIELRDMENGGKMPQMKSQDEADDQVKGFILDV